MDIRTFIFVADGHHRISTQKKDSGFETVVSRDKDNVITICGKITSNGPEGATHNHMVAIRQILED